MMNTTYIFFIKKLNIGGRKDGCLINITDEYSLDPAFLSEELFNGDEINEPSLVIRHLAIKMEIKKKKKLPPAD